MVDILGQAKYTQLEEWNYEGLGDHRWRKCSFHLFQQSRVDWLSFGVQFPPISFHVARGKLSSRQQLPLQLQPRGIRIQGSHGKSRFANKGKDPIARSKHWCLAFQSQTLLEFGQVGIVAQCGSNPIPIISSGARNAPRFCLASNLGGRIPLLQHRVLKSQQFSCNYVDHSNLWKRKGAAFIWRM